MPNAKSIIEMIISDEKLKNSKCFSSTVYKDEPIIKTASQMSSYVPPKISELQQSIRKAAQYSLPYRKDFYEQARLMEDYEDDYVYNGKFNCYYPTYRAMNTEQLRGYFSWRSRVRRGDIQKTSLSFVFVYIYELLHLVGVSSAVEGFQKLSDFGRLYGALDYGIKPYLKRWLRDFVVFYGLDNELFNSVFDTSFEAALITLKDYQKALLLKHPDGECVPSESTVYRVMHEIGITHRPRRKPNGITKADREAMKSDDLLKRDFKANKPREKCVTDITEVKGKDGKLYTSMIFDCFDLTPLGISMDTNMKAELCIETVKNAVKSYPELKGAILHSDRGSQYTSEKYRGALKHAGFVQSMNSAGGRCHDNARCESMWARMKEELFYSRNRKSENYTVSELKTMIWRYYMSYWNNRRICSANGGLPPAVKRKRYYESLVSAA